MSGGVDSSVAAMLLKHQGYDVIGVHMQLWDHGDANTDRFGGRCCSLIDSNDARKVCDRIEAPYYVINAQDVFKESVVDYFVHEYLQNRTPNPCVECNTKIKFNYLFKKAEELGCEFVATGHYSQIVPDPNTDFVHLYKSTDPQKDQSYFLFGLTQKALRKTLMPLGGLSKQHVRKLAAEFNLGVAEKEDSMEICFIGEEGYQSFIENRIPADLRKRGPIRTSQGKIVGDHQGLHRFTIGQRKGLNLQLGDSDPFFVVGFNPADHALIVGPEAELLKHNLIAEKVNWLAPRDKLKSLDCKARIRSRHQEAECRVHFFENDTVRVEFKEPQRAITPGQSIVFYRDNEVLGGGFIERVLEQPYE